MRLHGRWLAIALVVLARADGPAPQNTSPVLTYQVLGDEPGAWPDILSAVGFQPGVSANGIVVIPQGVEVESRDWLARVERGTHLVLEGSSPLAESFGFRPTNGRVRIRSVQDIHRPSLQAVWEHALDVLRFETPAAARVFTKEKWEGAPLVAGMRYGAGSVLWLAVPPGANGRERFPYLLQALASLGAEPALRSASLWAFFDTPYRARADVDYLTSRWRKAGIAALHVAAWHYWEPDAQRDAWLRALMEACHRNAILVYAWIEFPHVSEEFWRRHPEWREKTALLQDAHLDWRKLMNLENTEARAAVQSGLLDLLARFDWDGVNLAELYFESLHGHKNAARFTPMNSDVRRAFQAKAGFDPFELFTPSSERHHSRNPTGLRAFLDYRVELAHRWQEHWMDVVSGARRGKPHLDLVLTHVDDRFDTRMRDLIGADAERVLPMLESRDFTFLIEDPATIWHLGPQRYPQIASRYAALTRFPQKLAIDINIVERYQDVYPTKQQTGVELFQLVNLSQRAFERVALYFENSILPPDYPLLSASAAVVDSVERVGTRLVVRTRRPAGLQWSGAAAVNGKPWPVRSEDTIWLPPGSHVIDPAPADPAVRVLHFNGTLLAASQVDGGIEIAYRSPARAIAIVDPPVQQVEVDGEVLAGVSGGRIVLPRGQHLVTLRK